MHGFQQLPCQLFRNPYPPLELLSGESLQRIHHASLTILRDIGVNFLLDESRRLLAQAGAQVDPSSTRVRFDPELVESLVAMAPCAFELHARNAAKTVHLGGDHIVFAAVSSPPNCSDIVRGRRSGTFDDFCDFLRLTQSINVAQAVSGHSVEPVDIPTPIRHLVATQAMIELTDKPFKLYPLGRQRVLDVIEMVKIAFQIDDAELARAPRVFTNVNANSPLQYDIAMLWGMIECGLRHQPVIITPFTLAGAMAPVTLAGALAQQNAEALAGIAFMQALSPGCPVVYGGYTSNVDMKTGSPAFGTPENVKATLIGGQLARRYQVPYRSSNNNASNAPDVQSAYESMMSLWAVVMSHTNYVNHALGWLEGGLCASFEKFMIDAEMIQHLCEVLQPVLVDDAELALDAIKEVGPGGHFFGAQHTLDRFETAFYAPFLSDWSNFENWTDAGALDATQRAHRRYKQVLAEYQRPAMDAAVSEQLVAFVERRKAEGGAPMQ